MDDFEIKDEDMPEIKRRTYSAFGWNIGSREAARMDECMDQIISIVGNEADGSVACAVGRYFGVDDVQSDIVDYDDRLGELSDGILLGYLMDLVLDKFSSRQWAVQTAIEMLTKELLEGEQ